MITYLITFFTTLPVFLGLNEVAVGLDPLCAVWSSVFLGMGIDMYLTVSSRRAALEPALVDSTSWLPELPPIAVWDAPLVDLAFLNIFSPRPALEHYSVSWLPEPPLPVVFDAPPAGVACICPLHGKMLGHDLLPSTKDFSSLDEETSPPPAAVCDAPPVVVAFICPLHGEMLEYDLPPSTKDFSSLAEETSPSADLLLFIEDLFSTPDEILPSPSLLSTPTEALCISNDLRVSPEFESLLPEPEITLAPNVLKITPDFGFPIPLVHIIPAYTIFIEFIRNCFPALAICVFNCLVASVTLLIKSRKSRKPQTANLDDILKHALKGTGYTHRKIINELGHVSFEVYVPSIAMYDTAEVNTNQVELRVDERGNADVALEAPIADPAIAEIDTACTGEFITEDTREDLTNGLTAPAQDTASSFTAEDVERETTSTDNTIEDLRAAPAPAIVDYENHGLVSDNSEDTPTPVNIPESLTPDTRAAVIDVLSAASGPDVMAPHQTAKLFRLRDVFVGATTGAQGDSDLLADRICKSINIHLPTGAVGQGEQPEFVSVREDCTSVSTIPAKKDSLPEQDKIVDSAHFPYDGARDGIPVAGDGLVARSTSEETIVGSETIANDNTPVSVADVFASAANIFVAAGVPADMIPNQKDMMNVLADVVPPVAPTEGSISDPVVDHEDRPERATREDVSVEPRDALAGAAPPPMEENGVLTEDQSAPLPAAAAEGSDIKKKKKKKSKKPKKSSL